MTTNLHIAGIGASAGGLEAMLPMFAQMPRTGRLAYVVAQHMAKDGHDELVVRLMARESALPVMLAAHGVRLAADTVYVIPSGSDGRVMGDTLSLSAPGAGHLSTPSVNALFASIAEAARTRGIGIVLSGTGSDGVTGCRAIKAAGGTTLAQDPLEAKFNGMPTAAIDARVIDRIAPVAGIGALLAAMFPAAGATPVMAMQADPSAAAQHELATLLRQVHQATGIDFSSYKEDTLLRRLEKRKATLGEISPEAYQQLIRRDPAELKTLQHLFLVSVSSFFRDRASFDTLKMSLAKVVAGKPEGEPVRVWVPGCASGEEPYTLAILLRELSSRHPVVIVATDLNPEALAMSREGIYRLTAFKEMPVELRNRYFQQKGQHFEIAPEIKACVQFEQRDVLGGTPPANLDLVSCRNLLIYMKSHLQDQLIKRFYDALRAQGLLFIGQSESLSFVGNSLFVPIDHYHRLFRRRY
jgi:chemotaxis protein methyltransferase CheR/two-component system CheB/CheR fusion protein